MLSSICASLRCNGEKFVLAEGGNGGFGNAHFKSDGPPNSMNFSRRKATQPLPLHRGISWLPR
jgi:GTPase involved in cell partitioning and DNA repair